MHPNGTKIDNSIQIKFIFPWLTKGVSSLENKYTFSHRIFPKIAAIFVAAGAIAYLLTELPAKAQIIPDSTLPTNSSVIKQGDTIFINGGTRSGVNLFHSFEQFSIPTGNTGYFNNSLDTQNIIGRVTSSSISEIDGLIKANGTANLFLLNSNGIIVGLNARLDIGGSFLATTADSISFADGTEFRAKDIQNPPLLTVSVPVGLGFGGNPGEIRILGRGHDVTAFNYLPINRGNSSTIGLKVSPQQTLAIVGGDVLLEGGVLTAEGGRIEVGSVDNGLVNLNSTPSGWSLGCGSITAATASGEGGDIFLRSQNLQLRRGSSITTDARGGSGSGGNITIDTDTLVALEDSDITANAFGDPGGNVRINTQGIFGTQFREQLTPESDITASSEFGVSGVVEVNNPDTDPSRGLITLPTELVDVTGLIAQGCPAGSGPQASKFVITGRGGLPDNPNETLNNDTIWTDLRPTFHPAEERPSEPPVSTQPTNPIAMPLVEANGWIINSKGEVVLTATAPSATL